MRVIEGHLVLPGGLPAQHAKARISLIDATYADAAATAVATTEIALTAPLSGPVPFRLAVPQALPPKRRWLIDATVMSVTADRLAVGDYVLDRAVEYLEHGNGRPITLNLVPVT